MHSDLRASLCGSRQPQTCSEGWHCRGRCKTRGEARRTASRTRGEGFEEADALRTLRINPRAECCPDGGKGAQVRWGPRAAGASRDRARSAHTRCLQQRILGVIVRMNEFITTNSPMQPETCGHRRVPNFLRGKHHAPRCSRRHRLLLSASLLPLKSSRAQLGPRLPRGTSGPSARLTSSLHPHIHTLPTAPAS